MSTLNYTRAFLLVWIGLWIAQVIMGEHWHRMSNEWRATTQQAIDILHQVEKQRDQCLNTVGREP